MINFLPVPVIFYFILAGCILLPKKTLPQEPDSRIFYATRITTDPPQIDGLINEEVWQTGNWQGDFTQREPYDGIVPSENTTFTILFDDQNLYVAIIAYDTKTEKMAKRLSRRDDFDGDWVGIAFDSYFDKLTAFSFGVTAAGVKNDLMVTDDDEMDDTWDPVWYVKTSINSESWIAELRVPLTQIRFADVESHIWGLQVMRWLFRKEEFSIWKYIPQKSSGWVSLFGELHGIENIDPKHEVELIPYFSGNYNSFQEEEGNPFTDGSEFGINAGLDGKVAVTNDLTMNLTINPDFGQVEADPSEVNLTAFETFFPEKRPFFIEGSNIYKYNLTIGNGDLSRDNLFYSRRIGRRPHREPDIEDNGYYDSQEFSRILGAIKLSGKTRNGWSVGIMESLTDKETARIEEEGIQREETVEPMTNFYNTRVQKDINKGKTIVGGMVTTTNRFINDSTVDYLAESAYTGGIDLQNFWKDKSYYLGVKGVFSRLSGSAESITDLQKAPQRYYQRPDANHLSLDTTRTNLSGWGGTVDGGKIGGGHWNYLGWVTWRSPGLELNDQGYLRQADLIQQVAWAKYRIWEPFSIFREFQVNFNQYSNWDFAGNRLYLGGNINFDLQFKNYWSLGSGVDRSATALNRAELRGGPALKYPGDWNWWISCSSDERKKLNAELSVFNNWGGDNSSRFFNMSLEINYRPVRMLELEIEPAYRKGRRQMQYIETVELPTEDRYIISTLNSETTSAEFKINLSLTPDLTIQYWGQPFLFAGNYSSYKRVTDPSAKEYTDRFHLFTGNEILYDSETDRYLIDENGDGNTDYTLENPNFNFYEYRSNLVLRWEYIPGSTLYFVWSQGRTGDNNVGDFDLRNDMDELFEVAPHNTFQIKISYRISL